MEFERRGGRAAPWLLCAWLAGSVALAAPAVWRLLDYFRSPGPQFHTLILGAAPALFAASLGYAYWRPRILRRAEPWLFVCVAVGAPWLWKPLAAVSILALLLASLAVGRRLLEVYGLTGDSPLERSTLAAGVGFALLIPVLAALGPGTGFQAWLVAALLLCAGALRRAGRDAWACFETWRVSPELNHPLAGVATALAVPFLDVVLALALAPALAHDALMMHLPAALHYAALDELSPLPHLSSTYYPQGGELLMAAAASLAGRAGAQLVQPAFFALTLGALWRVAARAGIGPTARYVGTLTVAALPFLAWTGGVAKNDMPMALFQALALLCAAAANGETRAAWLRLGVFFLAASFSVKPTAMFGAVPLGLLLLWRLRGLDSKARELLIWAGTFAVIAGFWPLRTYILTGNPLYPAEISWAVESLRPNAMRPPEWRSIPYWKIPWTIHFDGTKAFESPSASPMGFFLWLFAPLWLCLRRREGRTGETLCLAFAWIYFFYWGSVWPVVRYAIIPLGVLTILTAGRLVAAYELLPRGWRLALVALTGWNGVACLLSAMIFSINAPQLELFAGRIDEREYLRRALLPYPVLERLAQEWRPGDWTLGVGVTAAAYAPDPSRFDCERTGNPAVAHAAALHLLASGKYRFLIADTTRAADALRDVAPELEAQEVYADRHFRLHRLRTRRASGEPAP